MENLFFSFIFHKISSFWLHSPNGFSFIVFHCATVKTIHSNRSPRGLTEGNRCVRLYLWIVCNDAKKWAPLHFIFFMSENIVAIHSWCKLQEIRVWVKRNKKRLHIITRHCLTVNTRVVHLKIQKNTKNAWARL